MPVKLRSGKILVPMRGENIDEGDRFDERLREIRRAVALTQPQMADKLHISDRTYKYYEQGHRKAPLEIARKCIILFDLDAEWFLFGENGRHKSS